ncbi:MAG TPA: SseB family protein [Microbacteriaceae bacterium]|nr:SseB family protein [Microbacteriaceae bacterium]
MSEARLFGSSDAADSAGQPWAGRSFDENRHASDDGSSPEDLVAAVAAFRAGNEHFDAVVDAVRHARLLVPLIAVAGETGLTADGLVVDKTQELSIVTVATPDGRTALPLFSSVDAMRGWNPEARPVPTDGVRAALAAAGEGTPIIILDPGSPGQVAIRRPAVWAIAKSHPWRPPHLDPDIQDVIAGALEPQVRGFSLRTADPRAQLAGADLEVELVLDPGLDRGDLGLLLQRVTAAWFAVDVFAERVDQLGLKVVPAAN